MENYIFEDRDKDSSDDKVTRTSEIENTLTGESLDLKGGRILHIPDLSELSDMGFEETELRRLLRLRHRYQKGDHEETSEVIRLKFGRYLYETGKISA